MPRETKAELAARVAADNVAAAAVPAGVRVESPVFGTMVLGRNLGPDESGWDLYEVQHSGYTHKWSSALIRGTFAGPPTTDETKD